MVCWEPVKGEVGVGGHITKGLHWFSGASVMNYYKLDGLNQQECIPSQLWGLEI